MNDRNQRTLGLCGWGLFVVSAVFFILSALRSGDALGLIGGALFFAACILFIAVLLFARR